MASVNWDAIGAISAAAPLVAGAFFAWRGGLRSPITADVIWFEVELDGEVVEGAKIKLKNRGVHIENCKVRLEASGIYSARCYKSSSVPKAEIGISREPTALAISIPDFPSGEEIEIDIAYAGFFARSFIKAGSNRYKLVDTEHLVANRLIVICVSIALSVFMFKLVAG